MSIGERIERVADDVRAILLAEDEQAESMPTIARVHLLYALESLSKAEALAEAGMEGLLVERGAPSTQRLLGPPSPSVERVLQGHPAFASWLAGGSTA